MTTLTLDLHDISHQQIEEFNQTNGLPFHEVLVMYAQILLNKPVINDTQLPTLTDKQLADITAIRALRGKYAPVKKNTQPISLEEINVIVRQKFAEKWHSNDILNRNNVE